jgi:glycosyltransferase involved in cell wall biosynthesis
LKSGSIFFAYDTGALEAMEWCRGRGIKCVLNQMDPSRVEVDLVRSEEKQWPGWALENVQVPEAYFARREKEWALADRVVVNSEFSRQALLQQGVPAEKLVVVPLCFERGAQSAEPRAQRSEPSTINSQLSTEPLRVLFLGQVILRKGIQYLLAAAKLLEKENIRFDVVGTIGISRTAMATAPGNVTFHGRTSRDQAADWYRRSHLFVLPTLSDGFAITQLEAMAHGLPVIATPCCGEVVSDGVDGFIVPARDAGALARTFQRYLAQPEMREAHGREALEKSKQFTLERLEENLARLEDGMKY